MPKRIKLRTLTNEERTQLEKLSRSATESHRIVERAKMILLAYQGVPVEQIASKLDRSVPAVYLRLRRFGQEGIPGLEDKPRGGRKPTYSEAERGQMIALARTDPDKLGLPFGHWTLDRLVDYLHNTDQIGVSRAQLARILQAEGLRWYQEKTYFTERPDPQFVEKRGPS
jgi:transposase